MSDAQTQIDAALLENATGPQSVTTRDGSVTSQNLQAQMEYDRYQATKAAMANGTGLLALRPVKMVPPSAIGSQIQGGP